MLQGEEVAAMVRLHELGWGAKRLSKEFGCARNTVRRYLRAGGAAPFRKPERKTAFDGLEDWLREHVIPALPASTVIAIAGRQPPQAAWRKNPGWSELFEIGRTSHTKRLARPAGASLWRQAVDVSHRRFS